MDNSRLAEFIASFGSLNSYGSTVAQTKKALDSGDLRVLNKPSDMGIFKDALSGIKAIQKAGFSVDGIINVNKSFNHSAEEDPDLPGHLRNTMYNTDDNISVLVDQQGNDYYIPPEVVTKQDLQLIVDQFNSSDQSKLDALRVFADLSRLQPFQDGNKRTALIAANAALDTWKDEDYLLLPLNDLDRADFTINLMRYYKAQDSNREKSLLKYMDSLLPSSNLGFSHNVDLSKTDIDKLKTTRVKPLFRKKGREI
ncbi:Fic family protein [uncultured Limosilactobacillus sp.]|uniref:Fic family protein n=1 Tax=uncultured Limosilactobacillus sp. TaxID=2837629 RepID=UPI0025D8158A|nr:Fic family protein [uncultured Limosilactobacillus sp.]